jgi:uncharacterized membrane protein required for colicin V production
MKNEIVQKIDGYLHALAKSLGVASEYVMKTLTHQMFIEGLVYSIFTMLFIVVGGFVLYKLIKTAMKYWDDLYDKDMEAPVIIGLVILSIVYIVITIVGIIDLPEEVMKAMNPEYYALKEILKVFK